MPVPLIIIYCLNLLGSKMGVAHGLPNVAFFLSVPTVPQERACCYPQGLWACLWLMQMLSDLATFPGERCIA